MKKILSLILCLLLVPLAARAEIHLEAPPGDWSEKPTLTIIAFKVGRSDAMLLLCGEESMLVDGGYNAYRFSYAEALEQMDLKHVTYMFNTHPHDDHLMGFLYILENGFTADEALSPFPENYNDSYGFQQKLVRRLNKAGIPYRQVFSGETITLGDAVLTVLRNDAGGTVNDKSAVLSVRFGDSTALLTADIPGQTQHWLLENADPALLRADVLKAPHHGITAMVPEFLDAVDPGFIFGACFEKDAQKLVYQARKRGVPLYCAGQGRVTMVTDGTDWYIYQQKKVF